MSYFFDDFKNLDNWQRLGLDLDSLNRTGYNYLDERGNIIPEDWNQVPGGRWAALYHQHHLKTAFCKPEGGLIMKCFVADKDNPYKDSFDAMYRGEGHHFPFGECIPYLSWLSGGSREWSNKANRHVLDYDRPTWLYGPGVEIRMVADFTQMCVRNLRHSLWDMPTFELQPVLDAIGVKNWYDVSREELIERLANIPPEKQPPLVMSSAYDKSILNGVENDVLEYQYSPRSGVDVISQKLVVGSGEQSIEGHLYAGDTPLPGSTDRKPVPGLVDPKQWEAIRREFRENPEMEIVCRWKENGSYEYEINGVLTNIDKRKNMTLARPELTKELCSGVKDHPNTEKGSEELQATGPRRQHDAGLSAEPWILDKDLIDQHQTTVHSLEVRLIERPTQVQVPDEVKKSTDTCPNCGYDLNNPDIDLSNSPEKIDPASPTELYQLKDDKMIKANIFHANGGYITTVSADDGHATVTEAPKGEYYIQPIYEDESFGEKHYFEVK